MKKVKSNKEKNYSLTGQQTKDWINQKRFVRCRICGDAMYSNDPNSMNQWCSLNCANGG